MIRGVCPWHVSLTLKLSAMATYDFMNYHSHHQSSKKKKDLENCDILFKKVHFVG
jgi:hypothetical protein